MSSLFGGLDNLWYVGHCYSSGWQHQIKIELSLIISRTLPKSSVNVIWWLRSNRSLFVPSVETTALVSWTWTWSRDRSRLLWRGWPLTRTGRLGWQSCRRPTGCCRGCVLPYWSYTTSIFLFGRQFGPNVATKNYLNCFNWKNNIIIYWNVYCFQGDWPELSSNL